LLTKQLQNQDPLSPMDASQFTTQLVQFTGVEQQIAMNDKLDQLIGLQNGNQAAQALSYLGSAVEVLSDAVTLEKGGTADAPYTLPNTASASAIQIYDENDKL